MTYRPALLAILSVTAAAVCFGDKPFINVRGFEFRHGALFQQRALVVVEGAGCLLEGCLFSDPEVRGVTTPLSGKDQTDAPVVVRNNWVVNPGGLGLGASGNTKELTAENQDGDAPGRGRLIAEWNTVINNNCGGYPRFWESGGFKMFRLTGCVLRQNTFVGGDGPGIWLDWEHYNNRVEGNYSDTRNQYTALVRHDFYGLLHHPDVPRVAGACRVDPPSPDGTRALLEAEFTDGRMVRLLR